MSEYVTMYQRDYHWPEHKSYFPRAETSCTIVLPPENESQKDKKSCMKLAEVVSEDCQDAAKVAATLAARAGKPRSSCNRKEKDSSEVVTCSNQPDPSSLIENERGESRLCPCPRTLKLEFNENDTCIRKMLEKNPNLFNILKKKPCFDSVKMFNLERLRTTYQVDFDRLESPGNEIDWMKLTKKAVSCPMDDKKDEKFDCRPSKSWKKMMSCKGLRDVCVKNSCGYQKKSSAQIAQRDAARANAKQAVELRHFQQQQPGFAKAKNKFCKPRWCTEYKDIYDRTAAEILKDGKLGKRHKAAMAQKMRMQALIVGD
ncbi:hypothetical protein QAD02_014763 [Eretmocerus hayati]|uniref:Uncharacterized protein n=1 Tax=Eretmocerus hayati TaxID=131215 RepID=A0ACC2P7G6_9HYME|nr:hypothetical protein QAD02_014763 [Eretmocerus hayati]